VRCTWKDGKGIKSGEFGESSERPPHEPPAGAGAAGTILERK